MKLAFITHNFPIDRNERSNAGIFVWDVAWHLVRQGCSIIVFVLNSDIEKVEKIFNGKLTLYYLKNGSLKKSLGKVTIFNFIDIIKIFNLFIKGRQDIISVLNKQKVDYCVAFWAIPSGIVTYWVYRKLRIPYAIWALGSDIYIYNKYPIIGNLIFKSIVNSRLVFADGMNLTKEVKKMSNKKCIFLPSATDFKIKNIKKISLDKKKTNFVFLGRMEKVKGPDILFSSLLRLPKNANFHAYFIGSGSLLDKLKMSSKKYNLDKKITFLGNINSKDIIYSYLKECDYLIIPSRSDSIPLVLQEGVKAQIPVIVSDVGDMPDIVYNYKIGYVFPREDFGKLTLILAKLIEDREGKNISKNNFKKFSDMFNVDQIAKEFLKRIEGSMSN